MLRSLGEVVSPAVSFASHAPHQYTAETAGSKAHRKRTESRNAGDRCTIDPVATCRYPSIPVGSYSTTGSYSSTDGLEDEDEDEDENEKALACDTSSRSLFRLRQRVGTRCGDKVWETRCFFDLIDPISFDLRVYGCLGIVDV